MEPIKRLGCALPVQDMERAKNFYKEKLDLSPFEERPDGVFYEGAPGNYFFLYPSMGTSKAEFTQMGIEVDDVKAAVKDLREHGVEFEQYDFPGLKTNADGIADIGGDRGAWFKDSEGNLIALVGMR